MAARKKIVKTAPCRKLARDAFARQHLAMQGGDKAAYVRRLQLIQRHIAGKFKQNGDVAGVVLAGEET